MHLWYTFTYPWRRPFGTTKMVIFLHTLEQQKNHHHDQVFVDRRGTCRICYCFRTIELGEVIHFTQRVCQWICWRWGTRANPIQLTRILCQLGSMWFRWGTFLVNLGLYAVMTASNGFSVFQFIACPRMAPMVPWSRIEARTCCHVGNCWICCPRIHACSRWTILFWVHP